MNMLSLSSLMFLGIDPGMALQITVVVATAWTALSMLAVVFFAWAPQVSEKWRSEFGANAEIVTPEDSSGD